VLVVSGDRFNASAIRTVTVAVLTTNLRLAESPGNILIDVGGTGPTRESVVNVSALTTVDRDTLEAPAGRLSTSQLRAVDRGLRLALGL
jgi:mRNA interferase MazF